MPPAFTLVAPDRLRIREGGGCLSLFGLPFFAAGVLLLLAVSGFVPMSNADRLPAIAWPLLVLMGTRSRRSEAASRSAAAGRRSTGQT
jgi:hypothetical protein